MNEFMRIGDICDILNGYAFKSSKYVADGIRVIRITNVQKGFVEDTNPQYYPVSEQREIEKYMLCEGDLLMSLTGNVGRVGLLSAEMLPAALNQRVACIRIRNPAVIYKPFLFHLLNSDYFENKCILASQGVAQKNMSTEWLKEYPIPSFSMDKQMEIASIFDKIDDLIARRKEQVRNMDQAVKSRFIELFGDQTANPYGWQQTSIGACCTLKSGMSLPADKENEGGAIPYVKVGDMNYPGNEQYITTSSRFVSEQTAGTGVFPVGTVVFPKRGGAIGTNKKRLTSLPICADLNVMGVTAGRRLTPQYLMAYFDTVDLGTLNNGSSVPQINNKDIAPLLICIPPMALQEQFAAFVEQTDKSKYYSSLSFRYCQAAANTYRQEWMTCRTSDF